MTKQKWNSIYKKKGWGYKYYDLAQPHEDIPRVSKIFRKERVKRILDVGCGAGRHLVYLANEGFEVYGIDIAKEGIRMARKVLKDYCLRVHMTVGNIFERLPYRDNFFDAIISIQVMQHGKAGEIKKGISEMKRVLKPNKFIFIILCGRYSQGRTRYCLVKTARRIVPRTYIPTIGSETGLTHYIYNKHFIKKHYEEHFKIIDLWRDKKDYYCFLGKNKKT